MQSATNRSFTRRVCWILVSSALVLTLGACSHAPKRIAEPDVMATVEGVRYEMRYFYGQDGTRLFRQAWIPADKTRGVLVIVHGFKDHGGRYADLGQQLAKQGFAVFAPDLRGHGYSEGPPQLVNQFNDYLVDLALVVRQARTEFPDTPVFLLGNDIGGTIATRFVEMIPNAVQGLALSGASLASQESKYKLLGMKALAAIAPSVPVMQVDVKAFSHDPEVVQALMQDPLVSQSGIPAKTVAEEATAIHTAQEQEQTEHLTLPLLVMHGVSDTVAPLYGSIALYDAAPSEKKSLKQYPGLGHDLWHESEKATVIADLTEWLNGLVKP